MRIASLPAPRAWPKRAEDDLVGECLGRRRRHAELCKKFKPLRGVEQRSKGDLREDPVEGTLYVREKDRHCFASAGGPVQEHLDCHRREVGATARDSSELGPLCLRDQRRHGSLPQAPAVQLAHRAAAEDTSSITQVERLLGLPWDRRHRAAPPSERHTRGGRRLADLGHQLHVEDAGRPDELHGHGIGAHRPSQLARGQGIDEGANPLELRDPGICNGEVLDDLGNRLPSLLVADRAGVATELGGEEVLPACKQLLPTGNDTAVGRALDSDRLETARGPTTRKLAD